VAVPAINEMPASAETAERRWLVRIQRGWEKRSLACQFLVVGGIVSTCTALIFGVVVTALVERAVTRNAGAATALYVDSVIAPLLPDMRTNQFLDDTVQRALDETLGQGALGDRLVAMRLWRPDGTILYSNDKRLIGKKFTRTRDLDQAFAGHMVANYDKFDVLDPNKPVPPYPLLEIYNPVLQPWSGDVVAVVEFYERAEELGATLQSTRIRTWLAVAAAVAIFFLLLTTIVLRGSRTIDRQAADLGRQVRHLTELLEQNRVLHARVQAATQRATALNEAYLRRLGADLHDGPAQLVAFASLRLDSKTVLDTASAAARTEISAIRSGLEDALQEIRSICQGLVLPHIETLGVLEVVNHVIDAYSRRTGMNVGRVLPPAAPALGVSERICIYRFLQEALNNGYRHCRGAAQVVTLSCGEGALSVSVADDGPGFDPEAIGDGSIGLAGMRQRIESLGGHFHLATSNRGTTVTMSILRED
jgi:signal transduction histidine kinase